MAGDKEAIYGHAKAAVSSGEKGGERSAPKVKAKPEGGGSAARHEGGRGGEKKPESTVSGRPHRVEVEKHPDGGHVVRHMHVSSVHHVPDEAALAQHLMETMGGGAAAGAGEPGGAGEDAPAPGGGEQGSPDLE